MDHLLRWGQNIQPIKSSGVSVFLELVQRRVAILHRKLFCNKKKRAINWRWGNKSPLLFCWKQRKMHCEENKGYPFSSILLTAPGNGIIPQVNWAKEPDFTFSNNKHLFDPL